MDLLNIFSLNLFIDILPDGVLSVLSNKSKIVNDLVYYDEISLNKISHYLNITHLYDDIILNIIENLSGPNKVKDILLLDFTVLKFFDFSNIEKIDIEVINLDINNIIAQNMYSFDNVIDLTIYTESSSKGLLNIVKRMPNIKLLNIKYMEDYDELYEALSNDYLKNLEILILNSYDNINIERFIKDDNIIIEYK